MQGSSYEQDFYGGVEQQCAALRKTHLPLRQFPPDCPWTHAQALDPRQVCDTSGDWNEPGH